MPRISVIVPIYNGEKTLKRCVNSILKQSFFDFELILIDDGSTDDTLKICNNFAKIDKRVTVYYNSNSGAAASRNFGMERANGDYFVFSDCDDCLEPDAFENMERMITQNKADIVMCGFNKVVENKTFPVFATGGVYEGKEINRIIPEIKAKDLIDSCCNKLYRKDFIKNTGVKMPENEMLEDTYFNLSLLKYDPKIVVTEKCYYNYYIHNGSTTRRYNPEKLRIVKQRARLLEECTDGNEEFCSYYYIKGVLSSVIDSFFALDEFALKKMISEEINEEEFKKKADKALYYGLVSDLVISVAKSGNADRIYRFCRLVFKFKYKFTKLFLRVR